MTPDWTKKPTIHGDLVTLRPFDPSDVEPMAVILSDPELLKLTGSVTTTAEAGSAASLADERIRDWYSTRGTVDGRLDLAVVERSSGELVGEVVLNEYDANANSASFRTLMGPAGRGRGLGTEAARLILGYGFETLGLHRIELEVYAFNPRAQRVYEKVGFVVEGVKRDAFAFDGEHIDEIHMAILEDEWAAHGGRPQAAPRT